MDYNNITLGKIKSNILINKPVDTKIENIKLKMFEKTMLPESIREETDGKVSYRKTGNKVERTTYTFVDEWGSKLVFLSNDTELRKLEGETGTLLLKITHDDYNRVNKVQFQAFHV